MRLFLLLALAYARGVAGVEPANVSAIRDGNTFVLHAEAELAAPPATVFRHLADYANWHRLSPSIIESEALPPQAGHGRVRSVARSCVLFLCALIRQVQEVRLDDDRRLVAVTVPGSGDLRAGRVEWRLLPAAEGTRVEVDAYIVPAFDVPLLFGSWAIKRALRHEVIGVFEALDAVAAEAG